MIFVSFLRVARRARVPRLARATTAQNHHIDLRGKTRFRVDTHVFVRRFRASFGRFAPIVARDVARDFFFVRARVIVAARASPRPPRRACRRAHRVAAQCGRASFAASSASSSAFNTTFDGIFGPTARRIRASRPRFFARSDRRRRREGTRAGDGGDGDGDGDARGSARGTRDRRRRRARTTEDGRRDDDDGDGRALNPRQLGRGLNSSERRASARRGRTRRARGARGVDGGDDARAVMRYLFLLAGRRARTTRRPGAGSAAAAAPAENANGVALGADAPTVGGLENGFALDDGGAAVKVKPPVDDGGFDVVDGFAGSAAAVVAVDLNSANAAPKPPLSLDFGLSLATVVVEDDGTPSAGARAASKRSRSALSSASSSNSTRARTSTTRLLPPNPRRFVGPRRAGAATRDGILGSALNPSNLPPFKTFSATRTGVARARGARTLARSEVRRRCAAGVSASSSSSIARLRFALGHGAKSPSSRPDISPRTTATSTSSSRRGRLPPATSTSPPPPSLVAPSPFVPLDSRARLPPTASLTNRDIARVAWFPRIARATPSDALVDDARAKDKRRGASDFTLDAGEPLAISPMGALRYAPRTRRTVSMARATPARERRAWDSVVRGDAATAKATANKDKRRTMRNKASERANERTSERRATHRDARAGSRAHRPSPSAQHWFKNSTIS